MPKKHLSAPFIKNLSPQGKRVEYYDQHLYDPETKTIRQKGVRGMLLRMTKAGSKSFYYRYWYNEKSKRYKIGNYPDWKLSEAREKARKLAAKVNDGIDPQAEKRHREKHKDPITFKELADEFKKKYLPTLKQTTRTEYSRIIDKELIPKLGRYSIKGISRNQIISLLDGKAYGNTPAPVMANRIRARLSKIYSFAIERGLIDVNPVSKISKYKKTKKGNKVEKRRNRYYEPEEIQVLWEYFDKFNEPTSSVFKMLLITGQRKTETMRMRWDDLRGDVWTIPANLAKNKEPHEVPLSKVAVEIIETMRPINGDTDYVFCSPKEKNAPMKWLTRARETIKNNSKVYDFRPHDLRRTVATYMAKLGVDRTVLGKILNHKGLAGDDQVTAIYDRHGYMKEKRQAMNKWSNYLQKILAEETEANIYKIG